MAVKTYGYYDGKQITPHFNSNEFRCKCGKKHNIKIDSDLCPTLEKVMQKLNAKAGNIYSGYRCPAHDRAVGGSGTGSHVQGYACDIWFKDKNNKRIPSDKVCMALEDLQHNRGVGYRCGNSSVASGNIHIDTKPRKWYGDEHYSMSASINTLKAPSDGKKGHSTYLTYIYKPTTKTVTASYLYVRNGKGTNYDKVGGYPKGTKLKVYYVEDGWAKIDVNKWVSNQYLK